MLPYTTCGMYLAIPVARNLNSHPYTSCSLCVLILSTSDCLSLALARPPSLALPLSPSISRPPSLALPLSLSLSLSLSLVDMYIGDMDKMLNSRDEAGAGVLG